MNKYKISLLNFLTCNTIHDQFKYIIDEERGVFYICFIPEAAYRYI